MTDLIPIVTESGQIEFRQIPHKSGVLMWEAHHGGFKLQIRDDRQVPLQPNAIPQEFGTLQIRYAPSGFGGAWILKNPAEPSLMWTFKFAGNGMTAFKGIIESLEKGVVPPELANPNFIFDGEASSPDDPFESGSSRPREHDTSPEEGESPDDSPPSQEPQTPAPDEKKPKKPDEDQEEAPDTSQPPGNSVMLDFEVDENGDIVPSFPSGYPMVLNFTSDTGGQALTITTEQAQGYVESGEIDVPF